MLPTKINVLGHEYLIEHRDLGDDLGQCDGDRGVIRLHNAMSWHKTRETLLHEVLHAIVYEQGLNGGKHEEKYVHALAKGLVNTMALNGSTILEFLFEREPSIKEEDKNG